VNVGTSTGGLLMGSGVWIEQRTNNLNGAVAGVRVYSGLRGTAGITFDKRADDPGSLFGVTH